MQGLWKLIEVALDDARLAETTFGDAAWRRELESDPERALRRFALARWSAPKTLRAVRSGRAIRVLQPRRSIA